MSIDIHWITDDAALARHCAEWLALPFVALDTEFVRVDTFYPQAGLVQICAGGQVYLIDPLAIRHWKPFAQLLEAPAVVKVLHSCSEDLEVFLRLTGSLPQPLYDTQLAAGFLNLGFSMGYSRLVQAVLDIELPKGETRSDWLRRPLSEMQVSYAAEDVLHLAEVYKVLDDRLDAQKRAWLLADGAELVANLQRETDPQELYREGRLAWKLNSQQLAVLRALYAWREREARRRDQPRNRVLKESSLWPLARFQPRDIAGLARIEDVQPRTLRQDGATLLKLIAEAAATPPEQRPERLPEPLPVSAGVLLRQLRAVGEREAQRLDMVPELLLRRKPLEALVRSGYPDGPYQLPDSLRGWRRELLGQALLDCLAGEKTES